MAIPHMLSSSAGLGLRFHARICQPNESKRRTSRLPISPRPMNPIFTLRLPICRSAAVVIAREGGRSSKHRPIKQNYDGGVYWMPRIRGA